MFLSVQYFKSHQFSLVTKPLFPIVKQRGGEYCCDAWCYFKSPHNFSGRYPTPFYFINFLFPLRNRYVPRCYVSMAQCCVDIQVSVISENTDLAQPTVLSVGLGSNFT